MRWEDLRRRQIRDYFARCDEEGRKYTLAGLKMALGADREQWEELLEHKEVGPALELAMARIRDSLEQREDNMALLLLKQPEYNMAAAGGKTGAVPGERGVLVMFEKDGDVGEYGA